MGSSESSALHQRRRLTSETLAAKWAELLTQALLILLVPRALGPPAYGEFAVAFAVVSVLSLGLGLGAPIAAIRYLPAAPAAERPALARAVAADVVRSRARILAVLTGAALVLAAALGLPLGLTLVVSAAAWCSVGSSIASELALALARPRLWNARFPLENGLVVIAAPAGHALSGSHGAIAGMAVASAATFAVLVRRLAGQLRGAPAGPPLPREAASYARMQTVTVIFGTFVKRGGPLAMSLVGASSVQTGFAAIATGVGTAGTTTAMSLLVVHLPRLVERRSEEPEAAEQDAARTTRVTLLIAMAIALPAALVAGPALELALGSDFRGARDAVILALPAVPLGAVLGLAGLVASLRLRAGSLASAWAVGGLVFAVVAAATIPSLDARGASLALCGGLLSASSAATLLLGGRAMRGAWVASVGGAALVLAAGALAA